jgi:hypothetical protein
MFLLYDHLRLLDVTEGDAAAYAIVVSHVQYLEIAA